MPWVARLEMEHNKRIARLSFHWKDCRQVRKKKQSHKN